MNSPPTQLEYGVSDRDLEKPCQFIQKDQASGRSALGTVSKDSRNASPDRLDPFDLDHKLSRRDATHSLCP